MFSFWVLTFKNPASWSSISHPCRIPPSKYSLFCCTPYFYLVYIVRSFCMAFSYILVVANSPPFSCSFTRLLFKWVHLQSSPTGLSDLMCFTLTLFKTSSAFLASQPVQTLTPNLNIQNLHILSDDSYIRNTCCLYFLIWVYLTRCISQLQPFS